MCEINTCGVQAIGRCQRCAKAFCLTHQGYMAPFSYNNLCSACIEADHASQAANMRSYEQNKDKAIKRLDEILDALIRAGNIGQIPQYSRKEKKRLWWYVTEQMEWGKVWPIGNIDWLHSDEYRETSIMSKPTGITSDKQLCPISVPADYPYADREEYFQSFSAPTGSFLQGPEVGIEKLNLSWALQAIKHLEEIAKRHNVTL